LEALIFMGLNAHLRAASVSDQLPSSRITAAGKSPVRIWVGTREGAFLFSSKDCKKWDTAGTLFAGEEVHHAAQDPREAGNSWHALAEHLPSNYSVSAALYRNGFRADTAEVELQS
jgi:hypothetical protein